MNWISVPMSENGWSLGPSHCGSILWRIVDMVNAAPCFQDVHQYGQEKKGFILSMSVFPLAKGSCMYLEIKITGSLDMQYHNTLTDDKGRVLSPLICCIMISHRSINTKFASETSDIFLEIAFILLAVRRDYYI